MSEIQVSAFRWVPPFAQGLVRDLRVRWALEEANWDYEELLLEPQDQKSESYRRLQPFGQVPAFKSNGLSIFESGAIVMHVAENSGALMPGDEAARAHVKTWMFASLNTVEPPIMMLNFMELSGKAKDAGPLRDEIIKAIGVRLDNVATYLGAHDYLVANRFTAADLLMTAVLRILRSTDLVSQRERLEAYRLRCEDRPAFKKALAAQMATFAANEPRKH
jgi:glutathione S-transferase